MSSLDATFPGDVVSSRQHNEIIQLLKRKVTGPLVVETAEGWHVRRDPTRKQAMMGRITGSVFDGTYAWERVTLDPDGVVILIPGGETGDNAINLAEIITPLNEPVLAGTIVQLILEVRSDGQRFHTFVVGGGGSVKQSRIVKMTQIIDDVVRCVEMVSNTLISSGDAGFIVGTFNFFQDLSATFIADGIQAGMTLIVIGGVNGGNYEIIDVLTETAFIVELAWEVSQGSVVYEIKSDVSSIDYSHIFEVKLELTHRFLPYVGPGDHVGGDLRTFAGQTSVLSEDANFTDPSNPVLPRMYIEIFSGADAGRHRVVTVGSVVLTLAAPMNDTASGLVYRIDIVSEHATSLQLINERALVPDQNRLEVKIARAIRDQTDAIIFDISREGGQDALNLFNEIGSYLACYRLQVGANDQGLPIDDRVIIGVKPWRGHTIDGVLFFDANAEQKFDLSDLDEPVLPIGWYRDHWRLEFAIARAKRQEPTNAETCP